MARKGNSNEGEGGRVTSGHTSLLIDTLKKLLRAKSMTYKDLGKALGKSEASIKRLFAKEALTLKRLEEICACLDVDLFELANVARSQSAQSLELTVEQEAALAADVRLLGVFYLVLNDWTMPDMIKHYEIEKAEAIAMLAKLEHLDIIRLLPGDRVRLLIPRTMRLRNDGPIRREHGNRVIGEFVSGDFVAAGGMFRMELRELSEPSYALMLRKLERLCQEFNEMAELDSYLPSEKRKTIGMSVGTKPWSMTMISGIKVRGDGVPVKV